LCLNRISCGICKWVRVSIKINYNGQPCHKYLISVDFRLWSHRVCLLLQYLLQSCSRGGRGIVEDMWYESIFSRSRDHPQVRLGVLVWDSGVHTGGCQCKPARTQQ
jgi:hypothetical protein